MSTYGPREFELTADLVTLLRRSYVRDRLSNVETGAAEIDGKRPYGNSDVWSDVAEILGWPSWDDDDGLTEEVATAARALHEQTPLALQVVLGAGSFEPGLYRTSKWYLNDWTRVS